MRRTRVDLYEEVVVPSSQNPECPLCPDNGLVTIVAEAEGAYLAKAVPSPIEGCFLIVPDAHITDIMQLSATWQLAVAKLLKKVPWYVPGVPFNLSLNVGRQAGQRLAHLHFWVIPREEEEDSRSYSLGTATLIRELNGRINT